MPNCLVCDEKQAARHYGSICCSGCKGFFRRSVRFRRQYVCAYDKKCTIRREYRNCCRACRFQKCIDIGLDPMMVHSDRSCDDKDYPSTSGTKNGEYNDSEMSVVSTHDVKPFNPSQPVESSSLFNSKTSSTAENDIQLEHNQNLTNVMRNYLLTNGNDNSPLGAKNFITPFKKNDFNSVKRYYILVEKLLEDFREHDYSHLIGPLHKFNLNVPLEKAFLSEPRLVSDRSHVDWNPKLVIRPAWYARCWSRILVYYVDWVSFIPELAALTEQERIHLTIGRLAPCVWSIVANRSVDFHKDGSKRILLSGGTYFPMDDEEQMSVDPSLSKFLVEACKWVFTEVVEPALQMNVTAEEFALLRVICFLTPVPLLSRKAKAIIRNAQNYYRSVLTELVVNCSSTTDFLVLSKRLSSILMLLTPLEKTAQIEDENMAVMSMFDLHGMQGSLPYEFFVRRSMRF